MPRDTFRFPHRIQGIPCEVEVSYSPPTRDIPPGFSHGGLPGDPEEVELYQVFDRKGYPARWLERLFDQHAEEESRKLLEAVHYLIQKDKEEAAEANAEAQLDRLRWAGF